MNDVYITVDEARKRLGFSRQRVHALINESVLRSEKRIVEDGKAGRPDRTFVLAEDVEAYLTRDKGQRLHRGTVLTAKGRAYLEATTPLTEEAWRALLDSNPGLADEIRDAVRELQDAASPPIEER